MTILLLLALAWLTANVALVLMLRRNARVRDGDPGRAPRGGRDSRDFFGRVAGRP